MMDGEDLKYAQARDKFIVEPRGGLQANLSQYGL